jgi:hypothetical protein
MPAASPVHCILASTGFGDVLVADLAHRLAFCTFAFMSPRKSVVNCLTARDGSFSSHPASDASRIHSVTRLRSPRFATLVSSYFRSCFRICAFRSARAAWQLPVIYSMASRLSVCRRDEAISRALQLPGTSVCGATEA